MRGADLAFGTDAVTGLCAVGSVWWRYLALGRCGAGCSACGPGTAVRCAGADAQPQAAGRYCWPLPVQYVFWPPRAHRSRWRSFGTGSGFVRFILECLCSAWLSTMGRCWLSPERAGKSLAGGLYLAVAGSAAVLLERADALYGE
ncbi:MAG: hypothetical protein ACLVJH_09495 [Faecalibacterium prausnitzii]